MREKMTQLQIDHSFAGRYLNEGFSGGEKKRAEVLQMAVLEPQIAVLDETDSGLDIDALRIVADGVNSLTGPNMGALDHHSLSADAELHQAGFRPCHVRWTNRRDVAVPNWRIELEEKGYEWIREKQLAQCRKSRLTEDLTMVDVIQSEKHLTHEEECLEGRRLELRREIRFPR